MNFLFLSLRSCKKARYVMIFLIYYSVCNINQLVLVNKCFEAFSYDWLPRSSHFLSLKQRKQRWTYFRLTAVKLEGACFVLECASILSLIPRTYPCSYSRISCIYNFISLNLATVSQ